MLLTVGMHGKILSCYYERANTVSYQCTSNNSTQQLRTLAALSSSNGGTIDHGCYQM